MNGNPTILTERVDDVSLLIEHMQRMGLPALFDYHVPPPRQLARSELGLGEHDLAQVDSPRWARLQLGGTLLGGALAAACPSRRGDPAGPGRQGDRAD
jgi:hypothetical protein